MPAGAEGRPARVGTDTLIFRVFAEDRTQLQLFRFDPVVGVSRLIHEAEYAGARETSSDGHRDYAVFDRISATGPHAAPLLIEVDLSLITSPVPARSFVVRAPDYWLCR